MWDVTGNTPFSLNRRMFEREWALLVRMTFNARCVYTGSQSGLLEFETAVRVVAISTAHCTFQNLVVKGHVELMFDFVVAAQTELGFAQLQQFHRRESGLLSVCRCDEGV